MKPIKDPVTGRLDSFTTGSATFRTEGGAKTYALTMALSQEWKKAGLLQGDAPTEVWIEFRLDAQNFIQPDWKRVQKPGWASKSADPTNGEIKTPQKTGTGLQKETLCTSPQTAKAGPAIDRRKSHIFQCEVCGETCTTITTISDLILNPDKTCDDLPCLRSRTMNYRPVWCQLGAV